MNLALAIEIFAGGQGSGCKGPNCGRPGNSSEPVQTLKTNGWYTKTGRWLPYTEAENMGDINHADTAAKYGLGKRGATDWETMSSAYANGHVRIRTAYAGPGKTVYLVEGKDLNTMEDAIIRLPKGAKVYPSLAEEPGAESKTEDESSLTKEEALEWVAKKMRSVG